MFKVGEIVLQKPVLQNVQMELGVMILQEYLSVLHYARQLLQNGPLIHKIYVFFSVHRDMEKMRQGLVFQFVLLSLQNKLMHFNQLKDVFKHAQLIINQLIITQITDQLLFVFLIQKTALMMDGVILFPIDALIAAFHALDQRLGIVLEIIRLASAPQGVLKVLQIMRQGHVLVFVQAAQIPLEMQTQDHAGLNALLLILMLIVRPASAKPSAQVEQTLIFQLIQTSKL